MLVYRGTRISEKNARQRRAKILFWYAYVHSLKYSLDLKLAVTQACIYVQYSMEVKQCCMSNEIKVMALKSIKTNTLICYVLTAEGARKISVL